MDARVLIETEGDHGVLEDLLKWLTRQDALRGRVEAVSKRPEPGHMAGGGLTEVLAVAVGAGGVGTVLAQALVAWCRHPRGSKVRIRLISPDGTRTEFDSDRLTDVESVIRVVSATHERVLDGGTDPGQAVLPAGAPQNEQSGGSSGRSAVRGGSGG